MPVLYGQDIRALILEVIAAQQANLQQDTVLAEVRRRLNPNPNLAFMPTVPEQRLILTEWYELFRTGYLAWGHDLGNARLPFCHLTDVGDVAIASRERDPINPAGYMNHVDNMADIDDVCRPYLDEALVCFSSNASRAAAVMLGCAAERLVLNIRDKVVARVGRVGGQVPANLNDWRIRTVMTAIQEYLEGNQGIMNHALREAFEAHWQSFAQQVRAARNDVGHPKSIEPITRDAVHAGFLVFPELAAIATKLGEALDA